MIDFTALEREKIRAWADTLEGEVTLRYATAGHPVDSAVNAYLERFCELAPKVGKKKDGDVVVVRPTLFIDSRVWYQALPSDRELDPFLNRLRNRAFFSDQLSSDVHDRLRQLRLPALVKVYITPHCPYCPTTVSTLLGLSDLSDQIRLTVIDGELFADAAQQDRVTAAPTVILDDRFRWTGSVDVNELVTMMLDRDPIHLGAEALKSMIEEGNAKGVSDLMRERKKLFPAFVDLLAHPRWSVRLGAMVAFETLCEEDPELAGQIVEPLTTVFSGVDDMTKGDLLHVLGESGNSAALPFLRAVSGSASDEEVRSAALEAIDKLRG